jgi:putative Ca2+/H+ antiporter (TMEM165/GDT1 family)
MSIEHVLRAFATVFPAELPDKTMIATIVLVARYRRPLAVWLGAVIAFTVHVIVAVAAGSALSLLPDVIVKSVVAAMFLAGAVLLFRAARSAQANVDAAGLIADASTRSAIVGSFGLVVLAEWGDLTQLATASLAATSGDPAGTGIGALVALASVAAIAAGFGRQLVARVPLHRVNYVGATVFAALAVWTLIELVRSSA